MFTIHVDTVYDLRLAVLPLATLCDEAHIKCSREKLSIIVVSSPYPFVASLRMLPTFFTSFLLHPDGDNFEEHRYKFLLQLFATNISNMYSEDLSMTIYIGGNQRLAPLKFEDPREFITLYVFRFYSEESRFRNWIHWWFLNRGWFLSALKFDWNFDLTMLGHFRIFWSPESLCLVCDEIFF